MTTDFHVAPDTLAGLAPHATRIAAGIDAAHLDQGGGGLATHQALNECATVWTGRLTQLAAGPEMR
jgi:hypothetical protein